MANKYDQKHNEKLRKNVFKKCQNLSKEEKEKRRKKARERYQSFTEEEKEKVVSIIRNISRSYLGIKLFFI